MPDAATAQIRPFRESDTAFAVEQTRREGWDSSAELFAIHLAHDPDGCFVAEEGGRPVAMVTSTAFALTGWIGNLIVTPEARRGGLGSRLMERAIAHLASRGLATLRLEADPLGVNIYRRLGFVDEFDSPRFLRRQGSSPGSSAAGVLAAADLAAIASFDVARFGDDRARLLGLFLRSAIAAFRVPARGAPAGYLMVQPSTSGARIGPWVADGVEAADELLRAAVAHLGERAAVVAIPGGNPAGHDLLESAGFVRTPSSLRMVRGPRSGAGRPQCVFGLASGAVG